MTKPFLLIGGFYSDYGFGNLIGCFESIEAAKRRIIYLDGGSIRGLIKLDNTIVDADSYEIFDLRKV